MPSPLNPSVTTPRQGDRSRASRVSPRNITGRKYAELHAEKAARDAAKDTDIAEVRRTEYLRGHDEGFVRGFTVGWDTLAAHLVEEGILDADDGPEDAE